MGMEPRPWPTVAEAGTVLPPTGRPCALVLEDERRVRATVGAFSSMVADVAEDVEDATDTEC